ncbi:MAG: UDP-N-acetylglucosamine 2-epimerase [Candidatus Freyarchaeota archaeon]|nr:UDP-N-acetylglucosamine 2-epimerase [Candidatus Jordarchaeia archaeon]MBS7267531.1 UDP-N-acetylglucosamine 2-epimerase [Candidatus Jordarchaeia archaeon]MBS7278389.1 UDP-N-acetylglucosamine 2-epimerase [Candidatus Jordarchaeia archaeon]
MTSWNINLESPEIYEDRFRGIASGDYAILVTVATKPDFYKQFPLVLECERRGVPVGVVHTGQHFDEVLGYGLNEFHLDERLVANLKIRGDLSEKFVDLFSKMVKLGRYLKEKFPNTEFIPIVHGDTLTAGVVPLAWSYGLGKKCVQNEAGLRGMYPNAMFDFVKGKIGFEEFINCQWTLDWSIDRNEPFPEQIDTFICGSSCFCFIAPHRINFENLVREGYDPELIPVCGNSVVDAVEYTKDHKVENSIFDMYPQLEQDSWLRVDIHRRGNLTETRFKNIVSAIKRLVVDYKINVCLVELTAMKTGLKHYGLTEYIKRLAEGNKNFLFTPLWKSYSNVVEFFRSGHCWASLTDSGSQQEELNLIDECIPLTCRFNTDRPESVMCESNVLTPPLENLADFVYYIYKSDIPSTMKKAPKIYGSNVSEKIIAAIDKIYKKHKTFTWCHEKFLGKKECGIDYL